MLIAAECCRMPSAECRMPSAQPGTDQTPAWRERLPTPLLPGPQPTSQDFRTNLQQSPMQHQVSPLAPRIPAIPRPAPVKSHRRASVEAPHLLLFPMCQPVSKGWNTLPQAIKAEEKNEKRVGFSSAEKRREQRLAIFVQGREQKKKGNRSKRDKQLCFLVGETEEREREV